MKKETERTIRTAALLICLFLAVFILIHAWKLLNTPYQSGTASLQQSADDDIWIDEVQLEANHNITQSLKEAVLGTSSQKKDLVVFEQNISDIIKVTDEGSLPFNLGAKYQYIKYSGTAVFTVDLSGIDDDHLKVDEEAKTLTIYIPHAVQQLNINEDETQADATEKIGIFSLGDLKLSEAERSEVIANVKKNMESKLEKENVLEIADRMAVLSLWEIYQPVVSKVSPEYSVVTEFKDD